MKRKFIVKQTHLVYCPECYCVIWSNAGTYLSKTITCPCCGIEVLR